MKNYFFTLILEGGKTMSEKDVMNETMEGTMELVEVPTAGNTLAKVAIAGAVVVAGVAVAMYIRKKRKANAVEAEVVEVKTKNSSKTEK